MPRTFLRELRRRRVYRVAVAYAIVGWSLIQIATQVFPFFHIPDWSVRLLVLLVLAGFPVALVLAWAFDATPHGIQRTETQGQPVLRRGQHGTLAIGGIGVLIAVLVGGGYWWWHRGAAPEHTLATAAATAPLAATATFAPGAIPEKSIAVLPLVNGSGNQDEQYFSDGLSEDLITALSQFAGLKVINRDSSFQFRHSKNSIQAIGEKLGVAHLLEGSVRRAGDEVRISAELVNAADGSTLWSQHYDRPYKDLFKLQDDITKSVADALKAKLLTANGAVVQSDRPPSGNLDAYNAFLQGNAYYAKGTGESARQAITAYTTATRLDPHYARAYAALSFAQTNLAGAALSGAEQRQAYAQARAAADTALALDPDSAAAHSARGFLLLSADFDWSGAETADRRALQLAPNDAPAKDALGGLLATLGQPGPALELTRQALASDPRHATWYGNLGQYLGALGRLDEAERAARTAIALQPGGTDLYDALAVLEILHGDAKAALAAAQQEPPGPWHDVAMTLALQIGSDRGAADTALKSMIDKYADQAPYQIAEANALRRDPDRMFQWLGRAWTNRDPGIKYLLYDPFILRYQHDPRFAAFCRKVGLPVPGATPVSASSSASL